jgi:ATP-dependent protease ClpP protease subunit
MDRKQIARARQLGRATNLANPAGVQQSWYRIQNVATDETEVFIYDIIGDWGVSADDFVRDLTAISTPKIKLRVHSPGGDVFDGIAIYNALAMHQATVTAVIDGLAASAASFIVCAAETTEIHRNARMMVHDARGICIGNPADMQEMLDLLNMASDNIADIYSQKTGTPAEEWRAVMKAEKWYTSDEAVEVGLADSVVSKGSSDDNSTESKPEDDDDLENLLQGIDLAAILSNAFGRETAK